ncbi:MAG: sugar transferase [bacterium]
MGKQDSFIKRITDIFISLIILAISSPIMLICMAAIRLESEGPAIFIQERMGKNCKPFNLYKLRGMVNNALSVGPELTQINDPRLTKTGKLFRRISIDEIPQFVNVLKGEMSVVGPRPEIMSIALKYNEFEKHVLDYKPGLTGYSQINGRQTLTPNERVTMEIEYYKNANFFSDLLIVIKTPFVILTNDGNI